MLMGWLVVGPGWLQDGAGHQKNQAIIGLELLATPTDFWEGETGTATD